MLIDFPSINKVFPKDLYAPITMDKLMDATSKLKIHSLIDAKGGYHLIYKGLKDTLKTTFTTGMLFTTTFECLSN